MNVCGAATGRVPLRSVPTLSLGTLAVAATILAVIPNALSAATMKERWRVGPTQTTDWSLDSVAIDPAGEIVASGFSQGLIQKFDRWGTLLWTHDTNSDIANLYAIPSADPPRTRRLAVDANGHIAVGIASHGDSWLWVGIDHLAPAGFSIWHALWPLGDPTKDLVWPVELLIDGAGNEVGVFNLQVRGGPNGTCPCRNETFIASVDQNGSTNWTWRSPVGFNYQVVDAALRPGGGLAVVGNWCSVAGYGCPTGAMDGRLFTFLSSGLLNWNRYLDGGNDAAATAVAVDGQGRVYAHATIQTTAGTRLLHPESEVYAFDSNGLTLWQASEASSTHNEFADGLAVAPSGNLYSAYHTRRANAADDSVIVRYAPNGAVLWSHVESVTGDLLREELAADAADRAVSLVSHNDGSESWSLHAVNANNTVEYALDSAGAASSWGWAVDSAGQPVVAGSNLPIPVGQYQLLVRYERFDYRPIRKKMVEGPIRILIPPVERQFAKSAVDWLGLRVRGGETLTLTQKVVQERIGSPRDADLDLYGPDRTSPLAHASPLPGGERSLRWTAPSPGLYWARSATTDGQFGDGRYYRVDVGGPLSPGALFSRTWSGLRHLAGSVALETASGGLMLLAREPSASGSQGVAFFSLAADYSGTPALTEVLPNQPGFAGAFDAIGAARNLDGTFWIAGTLVNPGPQQTGAALIDPMHGTVVSGLQFGGTLRPDARALLQLESGDLILVMKNAGPPGLGPGPQMALIRITPQGGIVWSQAYDVGANADPRGAVALGDNSIVVAYDGSAAGGGAAGGILRVSGDDGTPTWNTQILSSSSPSLPLPPPQVRGVAAASDGSLLLTGNVQNADRTDQDLWVARLDSLGNVQWSRNFGGIAIDNATAITATSDGGIGVAGWTHSYGAGGRDGWVLRLDAYGQLLWQQTYGTGSDEEFSTITEASDDALVVTGKSFDAAGGEQLLLMRLGTSGELANGCTLLQRTAAPARDYGISTAYASIVVNPGPSQSPFSFTAQPGPTQSPASACAVYTPGEVSGPGSARLVFVDHDRLTWAPPASGDTLTFNLYRGDVRSDLVAGRSGSCLQSGLVDSQATDATAPPSGRCNFYLVSGRNQLGEGPLGQRSTGAARENTGACR